MKSTGVLRRVDDLGRVVIPKEIRKNLKIRDGESLEIFVDNSNIILTKHSAVDSISNVAQTAIDTMYEIFNLNVIVTDREKVIAASNPLKKRYVQHKLSEDVISLILKRETYVQKDLTTIELIDGVSEDTGYIMVPIIGEGDPIGMAILLMSEPKNGINNDTLVTFLAKLLSKFSE